MFEKLIKKKPKDDANQALMKPDNELKNHLDKLRSSVEKDIRQACMELKLSYPNDELIGFALCTDDDVMSIYHVVCTKNWVNEHEPDYPDIRYLAVEWEQSASEELFNEAQDLVAMLAEINYPTDNEWARARDLRFVALVSALEACRVSGIFSPNTLLTVGSTDPSQYFQWLEMKAVEWLNEETIVDGFERALGYSEYRNKKVVSHRSKKWWQFWK